MIKNKLNVVKLKAVEHAKENSKETETTKRDNSRRYIFTRNPFRVSLPDLIHSNLGT